MTMAADELIMRVKCTFDYMNNKAIRGQNRFLKWFFWDEVLSTKAAKSNGFAAGNIVTGKNIFVIKIGFNKWKALECRPCEPLSAVITLLLTLAHIF